MDSNIEKNLKLHKDKGNDYFKKEQYKEAIEEFSKCIEINSNDHILYSNRSGAYAQIKMYQKALDDAEKCIQLKPDWPKGYSRKGLALYNLGLFEDAQKTYEKGLKLDPNNEALKEGLKTVQLNKDNISDTAVTSAVIRALRNNPKLEKYINDKDYIQKLIECIKQIQKDPKSLKYLLSQPDARLRDGVMAALGLDLSEMNEEEEEEKLKRKKEEEEKKRKEEEEKKKLLSKTPEHIEADEYKTKGNEFYKKKKFDEALQAYNKAIQLYPNDLTYNNNIAAIYLERKEYDKCIEECEKALERRYEVKANFSVAAKIYSRMGNCYMKMKEYEKAINMFEKSLLEENNRHIRTALKEAEREKHKADEQAFINPEIAEQHRQKGNEFFKNGNYPEAKKEYDLAIRRNPTDAKLYSNRAAALTKLLEYPSALSDTEKCLSLDKNFVKGWIRKGNLHIMLKEYNKAVHAFDEGLKIDPENIECKNGKAEVMTKIYQASRSDKIDEEQLNHAMADPEIQQILTDPQFNLILKKLHENPSSINEYMKDPKIADGINKLMMAGILKIA